MESTTQSRTTDIYTESIGTDNLMSNIKTYLLNPLSVGLAGFATFFIVIIITKLFGYLLGTNEHFIIQYSDVIYALTGFVFTAGAKFFEFFGKED